jgi:hypothetical protein
MNRLREVTTKSLWAALGIAAILAAGCAARTPVAKAPVNLTGAQEVPPVGGNASGVSTIQVIYAACTSTVAGANRCPQVHGTVTTTGFVATAAHIHRGKKGANGPVILPLVRTGDNSWGLPANAYISESDYGAYNDGDLYVNVHSANNPNGEVRGQLEPY